MNILFILDPLHQLKAYKDTSLAIMREASARGDKIYVSMQEDILLRNANVRFIARSFLFTHSDTWYELGSENEYGPLEFDAIIMRKDPPFDNEYLYSTQLLSRAVLQGAKVYNNPEAIRNWNEKLGITQFAQFTPEFIVTSKNQLIREFLKEYRDIILKPLDGMGGSGIFRLTSSDPNIGVILETITSFESKTIMAQKYIPEISKGDKRIILIDGDPLPYALARVPQPGETRGNLAAGGKGTVQHLSDRDRKIAITCGKILKSQGLFFVGLDVIGNYLTEVNITSPTGLVEITAQTNLKPAIEFLEKIDSLSS